MCTVVFIPGKEQLLFASLRDEAPQRAATPPAAAEAGAIRYVSPRDVQGGTWVGANNYGNVLILLNGAFEKHAHRPPYRMSRGLIVNELLSNRYPVIQWAVMNLEGIEPFTLIVFSEGLLFRLTWDGQQKHKQLLDIHTPHLFSSSTLYNADIRVLREEYFKEWIQTVSLVDETSLMDFFRLSYRDITNGFLMDRQFVRTIAYSFLQMDKRQVLFRYEDLLRTAHTEHLLMLQRPQSCSLI